MSDLGNEHLNLIANYNRMKKQRNTLRAALERIVKSDGDTSQNGNLEFHAAIANARRVLGEVGEPKEKNT